VKIARYWHKFPSAACFHSSSAIERGIALQSKHEIVEELRKNYENHMKCDAAAVESVRF
jgi:CDP-glycerol glycerophosphotransferase (TagB/SpsB family)